MTDRRADAPGRRGEDAQTEYLYKSLGRIEQRQDDTLRDMGELSRHLEARIDRVGARVEEARERSTEQFVTVNEKVDDYRRDVNEKLDDFDATILKLGIKTGAELGKVRASTDAVDKARARWRDIVSGQVLARNRVLVWVALGAGGIIYGWGFIQFVAKLLGAPI